MNQIRWFAISVGVWYYSSASATRIWITLNSLQTSNWGVNGIPILSINNYGYWNILLTSHLSSIIQSIFPLTLISFAYLLEGDLDIKYTNNEKNVDELAFLISTDLGDFSLQSIAQIC